MINCDGLVKIYETDDKKVMALEGLDLTVETGEMLAVIGKSGSGKSTLLNMIGGLETPTAGVLTIDGKDISTYSEAEIPQGQGGLCVAEKCQKSVPIPDCAAECRGRDDV